MIKFIFDFINGGEGKIEVNEPIGFDTAPFVIMQEAKRMGRDIIYAGDSEAQFTIYSRQEQEFDLMLLYWRKYWVNANVKLIIEFYGGEQIVIGNIDFNNDFETDEKDFIRFTVKQENYLARYKKNFDVPVNLRSDKTLYGEDITPVPLKRVFVPGKPTKAISTWNNKDENLSFNFIGYGQDIAYVTLATKQGEYDIKDSVLPTLYDPTGAVGYRVTGSFPSEDELKQIRDESTYIKVKNKLTNVTAKLTGVNLSVVTTGLNVRTRITIAYGTDYTSGEYEDIQVFESNSTVSIIDGNFTLDIPAVETNGFIFAVISVFQSFSTPGATPVSNSSINYFLTGGLEITATATAYGTVAPMMRLVDVLRYATKSASGLDISAPEFEQGMFYYDLFFTTPILMRVLLDKPVNITCKDIVEDTVQAIPNGDYQLNNNGIVFYGNEMDFYGDDLIYTFDQPYDEFVRKNNPRFAINQANLEFSSFASQKENEKEGTFDLVHGRIKTLVKNEAENVKEVRIKAIMDAFLIDEIRQKAYDLTNKTATQDDDKYILIDVVDLLDEDRTIRETSFLIHTSMPGGRLQLRNDQTFSFVQLGLSVGSQFTIVSPLNQGTYTVQSPVSDLQITLFNGQENEDGIENTTYDYYLSPTIVNSKMRTNEGFPVIEGLAEGDNYANLRFTAARILKQRYGSYLATANMFTGQPITVTEYLNNPNAFTVYNQLPVLEGGSFDPRQYIVTPYIYTLVYIITFEEYFLLVSQIQQTGGYCAFTKQDGSVFYGYIQQAELTPDTKNSDNSAEDYCRLTLTVEEKYMPYDVNVNKSGGTIKINNSRDITDYTFTIDEYDKLTIFDVDKSVQLSGVAYQRVAINEITYSVKADFEKVLKN